mmetsp:Transcript_20223/g.19162  ORF Transcript_20223/g.19162 Transcript_20223/m.19162 type:complete len:124 (+) Transcript_20223:549-920(+)
MKRNVLVTNSNRSSVSSCKSSFLTKANDRIHTGEEMEESLNEVHCCDNINSYSIIPKSVFSELFQGITRPKEEEKKRSNFGDYITKMDGKGSFKKSPFGRRRHEKSLNDSSQDTMRNSCFFQQ